jgi:HAD superfamily hydrolase (TIGR01549 family)
MEGRRDGGGTPAEPPAVPAAVPAADEPIEAVIFDLFDTLVDLDFGHLPLVEIDGRSVRSTYPDVHAALGARASIGFAEFASALLAVDREIAGLIRGEGCEVSTRERFARLAERLAIADPDLPDHLTHVHMGRFRDGVAVRSDHVAVLRDLRGRYRIGVCSNFSHAETALEILSAAGLREHVDAVAISETVGHRKPRAEPFRAVLADLGVRPERAVHVGDQLVDDVVGATAVGMRSAWAVRRVADPDERRRLRPDARPTWTVRSLDELRDLLAPAST